MTSFEKIKLRHRIAIGISPDEGDLAMASIDSQGNPGPLNSYVLETYGYTKEDLPSAEYLRHGFHTAVKDGHKSILFVVTVDGDETATALRKNLYATLAEFRGWFYGKKLWIPLMGTGSGGLTLEESYGITVDVINEFNDSYKEQTETEIYLSLPPQDEEAITLFAALDGEEAPSDNLIRNTVSNFKNDFYLVGTNWEDGEQIERFINDGIWEKGHEDNTYANIINGIVPGDIVIAKSAFPRRNISTLRVKAIGIVKANLMNGTRIIVDWVAPHVYIDIDDLGYYRNTIAKADINDLVIIFSVIPFSIWGKLFSPDPVVSRKRKDIIASLTSDAEIGPDYLDIDKDVNAFAKVMTARGFIPPLAIALFGKWGSGKSFFMGKLKDRIDALSAIKDHQLFCNGIVQIHFNAWSYMDANLWASIVTRIFEGLNEYIKENTLPSIEKGIVEEQLNKKLNISKEEIGILEKQKQDVEGTLSKLELEKEELNKAIDQQIKDIGEHTLWDAIDKVDKNFNAKKEIEAALKNNDSFNKTEGELKEIVPEEYWNNPSAAYEKAKSNYTFLKKFFSSKKLGWNIFWLLAIITVICVTPMILWGMGYTVSKADFTLPQGLLSLLVVSGAAWKRAESTYKKLQPIVASFWQVKTNHEKQISEAKAKFEQAEKAIKLNIEKNKTELLGVEKEISGHKIIITGLDFKLKQALSTEALYTFIEKRSNTEDYRKHLGIISLIRKDLEILNGLFTEHNTEVSKIKDADEFKKNFRKPLERVILYIDDLDRCPEENVVQVLEAVNLLMAFPLFIVVVGVDQRWVKNALIKKHYLQFAGKIDENNSALNVEQINPANYLEKIFQIPFYLKETDDKGVKNMIRKLANIDKDDSTETLRKTASDKNTTADNAGRTIDIHIDNETLQQSANNPEPNPSTLSPVNNSKADNPETLKLTTKETELLEDMSVIVGTNPRAIKRLVNTYRIMKAHQDFNYDVETDENEVLVIMFLLSLPIGKFSDLYGRFESFIDDYHNQTRTLSSFLQKPTSPERHDDLRSALYVALSDKSSYHKLEQSPIEMFKTLNIFTKRFTFTN